MKTSYVIIGILVAVYVVALFFYVAAARECTTRVCPNNSGRIIRGVCICQQQQTYPRW